MKSMFHKLSDSRRRTLRNTSTDVRIRGAKTEVFCCFRFCIFEANISFCVQSLALRQTLTGLSSFGNHSDSKNLKL